MPDSTIHGFQQYLELVAQTGSLRWQPRSRCYSNYYGQTHVIMSKDAYRLSILKGGAKTSFSDSLQVKDGKVWVFPWKLRSPFVLGHSQDELLAAEKQSALWEKRWQQR